MSSTCKSILVMAAFFQVSSTALFVDAADQRRDPVEEVSYSARYSDVMTIGPNLTFQEGAESLQLPKRVMIIQSKLRQDPFRMVSNCLPNHSQGPPAGRNCSFLQFLQQLVTIDLGRRGRVKYSLGWLRTAQ